MRASLKLVCMVAIATVAGWGAANAAFFGMPRTLGAQVHRIQLGEPTLPPVSHTRFCTQYPEQCKPARMVFRGGALKLTAPRWEELVKVNLEVNRAIQWERNNSLVDERWVIGPKAGDCNDYAVTKRHELLTRGWPARNLLLAEVVVPSGEHHLVLVVRTKDGDFLADNLSATIRQWNQPRYQWVRIQSPRNPAFWSKVASRVA